MFSSTFWSQIEGCPYFPPLFILRSKSKISKHPKLIFFHFLVLDQRAKPLNTPNSLNKPHLGWITGFPKAVPCSQPPPCPGCHRLHPHFFFFGGGLIWHFFFLLERMEPGFLSKPWIKGCPQIQLHSPRAFVVWIMISSGTIKRWRGFWSAGFKLLSGNVPVNIRRIFSIPTRFSPLLCINLGLDQPSIDTLIDTLMPKSGD